MFAQRVEQQLVGSKLEELIVESTALSRLTGLQVKVSRDGKVDRLLVVVAWWEEYREPAGLSQYGSRSLHDQC